MTKAEELAWKEFPGERQFLLRRGFIHGYEKALDELKSRLELRKLYGMIEGEVADSLLYAMTEVIE